MPKLDAMPAPLRPYASHGFDLAWKPGDREAIADCPFCGKEGHISVSLATGLGRCYVCGEGTLKGGFNPVVFLRKLWEFSDEATTDYRALAEDRGLIYPDTLAHWAVAKSVLTGEWLVPGYNTEGEIIQLYRYVRGAQRMLLLPTPGLGHGLFGRNLYDAARPNVWLCEGPWDGMALWEAFGAAKRSDVGLTVTGNASASLLAKANVLAVPSCTVFYDSWLPLFADKDVVLCYDSDPPSGKQLGGGVLGMRRVAILLSQANSPPRSISYLYWGPKGFDPKQKPGYDVRDFLHAED